MNLEIYTINGRRYRRPPFRSSLPENSNVKKEKKKEEVFNDTPDVYADEPICQIVKETAPRVSEKDARIWEHGKKWTAQVDVPASVMGLFVGQNRRSLKILEDETGCRVKTPRREQFAPCEISSIQSLENVQRCLDRIDIFLADCKKSMRVTHFVAIPCDHDEIQENFLVFRDAILNGDQFDVSCKNEKLFTSPSRLHLTLTAVVIFHEAQELIAIRNVFEQLEKEISQILQSKPLIIDVQGIDIMNDDASQVNVLYAKVAGENVQQIANLTRDRLSQAGFARDVATTDDDVLLHLTLMNSRYVAQAENRKTGATFDAGAIFDEMRDMYFGTVKVDEICLCPLMSQKPKTEFYDKLVKCTVA